jgi:LemA protein
MMKLTFASIWIVFALFLTSCGFQSIPQTENAVEAASADVTNQYKRRADLIPNLVNTVKGYASHERETLEAVTQARAEATSMTIDASKATPDQVAKYQQAQGQLSQALGRLMVVAERYPDLKADANFRDLQAQLEGTENRITVSRTRLIEQIQAFNNLVTVPPTSWTNAIVYKKEKKPQWDVAAGEKEAVQKSSGSEVLRRDGRAPARLFLFGFRTGVRVPAAVRGFPRSAADRPGRRYGRDVFRAHKSTLRKVHSSEL